MTSNSAELLRSVVSRIERLNEEIAERNIDKAETYKGARHDGFDPAVLKKVIAIRAKDPKKLAEQQDLIDVYMGHLGTPDATRAGARGQD